MYIYVIRIYSKSRTQPMYKRKSAFARKAATVVAKAGYAQKRFKPFKGGMAATLQSRSIEIKAVDGLATAPAGFNMPLNTTPGINPMNLIVQGTSFYNRIGRKINMLSVNLHARVTMNGLRQADSDYCRVMVIYDKQTNGALPIAADILQNVAQDGTVQSSSLCDINLNNRDRFVILADEKIVLPPTAVTTFDPGNLDSCQKTCMHVERFIKLKGLKTQFKADTAATALITDIATGSLIILTAGEHAAGTEGYALNLTWRLRYSDS